MTTFAAPRLRAVPRDLVLAGFGIAAAVSLTAQLAARGWWAAVPLHLAAVLVAVILAEVDLAEHRLPNRWTVRTLPWTLAALALAGWVHDRPHALVTAALAAVLSGGFHLVLALVSGSGLGLGDVKLSVSLGALTGWWSPLAAAQGVVLAFVVGGVVALGLLLTGRADRRTRIAFGPSMLLGAWWALLLG